VLVVLVILCIRLGLQVHGHKAHQDQEEQEEDDGQVEGHGAPWAGAVEQQLLVRIVQFQFQKVRGTSLINLEHKFVNKIVTKFRDKSIHVEYTLRY
jgi:hypothetical protein